MEIQAQREKHVKIILEVPERVLEHKYASFSLRVLHDGEGGQKQIDEIFYFRHEDLQSISTIRREAVIEFSKGLKNQFRKHIMVHQKDPETGAIADLEETKTVDHILTKVAPKIISMYLVDYLKEVVLNGNDRKKLSK